ncbi:8356_t:CDS:2 [Funneliformis geosporum]|uniref:3969_t:CDS:1 n=1 Tax=Funneliformis geosporum TaxID=1117311 RepID=A0A9W4SRA1_9GLOM|nr:3969_t:CDS:2 [Funneliformis geosporum]CAI2183933.1 8356_t:CDS:2 [Funneliformis geosporum]
MSHQNFAPKKLVKDVDPTEVQKFKESFNDDITKVLVEGDEGYEASLKRWSLNAEKKAGIVVQPTCAEDISKTLKFASQNNLDFAVCGGGHSTSGSSSSEGGILLHMRKCNKVRVDVEKKLVYAQGGAIFGEVDQEAWKYGLAIVGGVVDNTGIGGLTLGGGFGFLTSQHGLVIDNLVGATIITADGKVRELSSSKNEDLFWAIKGAGTNFGVIYEFVFKAHEQKDIVSGLIMYPSDNLETVLEATNLWHENRGLDETINLVIGRLPPKFSPFIALFLFSNDPSEQVYKEKFSMFYKCGEIIMEQVERIPYPKVNTLGNAFMSHGDRKAIRDAHFTKLSIANVREVLDSYIKFTDADPTRNQTLLSYEFYDYKKFASVAADSTAFAHRKPFYNAVITQRWINEQDDEIVNEWSKNIQEIICRDGDDDKSLYVNFESTMDSTDFKEERLKKYFGANLEKLKELKRKYDPNVFFRKGVVIWP